MHLNDLLDTVLVTRKDEPRSADPPASTASGATTAQPQARTTSTMADNAASPGVDACPVDHKTRELWLQQARASGAAATNPHDGLPPQAKPAIQPQQQQHEHQQPSPSQPTATSWSPWSWFSSSSSPSTTAATTPSQPPRQDPTLDTTRTISSIPRASLPGPSACPSPPPTSPPLNHEIESGSSPSGNWIYPSEKMFFDAMRRKGFTSTQVSDMKTVVPIHNAVNERAWAEIKAWEAPYTDTSTCPDGPRLYSFSGVKERMTPRARVRTLMGYAAPFDRHDWVVDRCGKRVEYVIDFYAGRADGEAAQGKVNFYLDVRPKVNSWEGVKMRVLRGVGLA
ncbi:Cytochrome c heme lyase [Coniochaeta hoffmannii]|uniref:Holocytochrome c-type synthase n=1 Tax=Coniochaeta hoffmannii TaxID=91930 RepID=A0AA38R9X7_9PEZI|nr:Cytochrome c heme lyase [Coniochaeta hoffmannii]